ncbi:hypothetical protein IPF37_02255 [bacterium]|nr:MAG: hypothetical protein IPF37_02255 [bacterium]
MIVQRLKLLSLLSLLWVSFCSAQDDQFNKLRQLMRVASAQKNTDVDLIIFSYDRPLQLRAYLESLEKRVCGLNKTYVLYRASDQLFAQAYDELVALYPTTNFVCQVVEPGAVANIKPQLSTIFEKSQASYFMFGVDDIVVTEEVDVQDCVRAMDDYGAYSFYLRLGKNITQCYTLSVHEDFANPPLLEVERGLFMWTVNQSLYDWNYPNSLDMSIFRKKEVLPVIAAIDYVTPNQLDAAWARCTDPSWKGICYEHSKMVNIPLNLVQETQGMRNMQFFSTKELLDDFVIGFKIDIDDLYKFNNNSPHMHYIPKFVYDDERMHFRIAK